MVATPNSVFFQIFILDHCHVAILIATDDDFTGDARESGHLFGCAKLMWFFLIFFLPFFYFLLYLA